VKCKMDSLLKSIREFICFNQKNTIKNEYLVSERHKDLKNYFNDPAHSTDELRKRYGEFVIHSYLELLNVFDPNKELINNIFCALGKNAPPRITIKTINAENVLNIYRSTRRADFCSSAINENTGFSEILHENKICYLENNLPDKFALGQYRNPRLTEEARQPFTKKEIEWKDCWTYSKKEKEHSGDVEWYSSTLILPMSIRSSESDKTDVNFHNHFFNEVGHGKDFRTIWGFLCFDSPDVDYFDRDEFVDVGYILADVLSLYLMFFYTHISGSGTIKKIETEIGASQKV
jgi:hypothetical protein